MSANFVTFYLIIVLITGPFFQYLPVFTYLRWEEVLLAKVLNQAPTIFLLGYLLFPLKKKKNSNKPPLILFLLSSIFTEIHHYIVPPDYELMSIVGNNIVSYSILAYLLFSLRAPYKEITQAVWIYAAGVSLLIFALFGFSVIEIFKSYIPDRPLPFFIFITFILVSTFMVFLSFLLAKPFKRTWFEIVLGIIAMVCVDIYIYTSFFVLNSTPDLVYTFGKILSSVGILLVVDGISNQKPQNSLPNDLFS